MIISKNNFWLNIAAAIVSVGMAVWGQPIIESELLPHRLGDRLEGVAGPIVIPNNAFVDSAAAQMWDFSAVKSDQERVASLQFVEAANPDFPKATYAIKRSQSGSLDAHEFYSDDRAGRAYHGFADPNFPPRTNRVFKAATIDLPNEIGFGDQWSRQVTFTDSIDYGFFVSDARVDFSCDAEVDGFGTIRLPQGSKPCLRVNEVHRYVVTDLDIGLPTQTHYVRNVYWLVQDVGMVIHAVSQEFGSPPPRQFTPANGFRMIMANVESLAPVSGLKISLKSEGRQVVVEWDPVPGALEYRIFSTASPITPWAPLQSTNVNSLTLDVSGASQFFTSLARMNPF